MKKKYEVRCRACVTYYGWVTVEAESLVNAVAVANHALIEGSEEMLFDGDDSEGNNLPAQAVWAQEHVGPENQA